jgi:S-adenosylmethionine:tRNA ribosyltransferase-isomerase
VYAQFDGAVAAPTAGLHFTNEVLGELREKGIKTNELTLHVSAGTFQPIKTDDVSAHKMHGEEIIVKKENLESILSADQRIAVGTTSMRTLESLYWYGAKLCQDPSAEFQVTQDDPYILPPVSLQESLEAVDAKMNATRKDFLTGHTEIFLYPGYTFRICDGLITNFHLPGSTLILLVAAFVGEDWKKIYREALENRYRFLSYGDSSLLLP